MEASGGKFNISIGNISHSQVAIGDYATLFQRVGLSAEEVDPGRVRSVLRWFRDNLPAVAGAVTTVLVNPLVGQVVASAGEAVAGQFRDALEEG